jgi:hypothetical protein
MTQKNVFKLFAIMFLILGIGFSPVFAQSEGQENAETVKTAISAEKRCQAHTGTFPVFVAASMSI